MYKISAGGFAQKQESADHKLIPIMSDIQESGAHCGVKFYFTSSVGGTNGTPNGSNIGGYDVMLIYIC